MLAIGSTGGWWREGIGNATFSSSLTIDRLQEIHDILHNVLVVDDCLLDTNQFLEEHRVVHAEFVVALLQRLQLLLRRDKLCVEKIHLLSGHHIVHHGIGLARRRRFSSDVVQGILVVGFEVRVLEFPRLSICQSFYLSLQ